MHHKILPLAPLVVLDGFLTVGAMNALPTLCDDLAGDSSFKAADYNPPLRNLYVSNVIFYDYFILRSKFSSAVSELFLNRALHLSVSAERITECTYTFFTNRRTTLT
jgi:hypothetical protein